MLIFLRFSFGTPPLRPAGPLPDSRFPIPKDVPKVRESRQDLRYGFLPDDFRMRFPKNNYVF